MHAQIESLRLAIWQLSREYPTLEVNIESMSSSESESQVYDIRLDFEYGSVNAGNIVALSSKIKLTTIKPPARPMNYANEKTTIVIKSRDSFNEFIANLRSVFAYHEKALLKINKAVNKLKLIPGIDTSRYVFVGSHMIGLYKGIAYEFVGTYEPVNEEWKLSESEQSKVGLKNLISALGELDA